MASKKAQVQWGTSSGKSDSEEEEKIYKVDTTWMMPLEIKTASKCKFLLKAGNRNYTLDGTSKNGGTSEMSLRRKYE
jgi:hypothetical protein